MTTRIATGSYYSAVLADLMASQARENTANQQVSTGKLGTDLKSFGDQTRNIVATNTVKARVDTMVGQLNNLSVKMNFQQAAVQQVSDVASQLKLGLTNALASGSGDGIMASVQSLFAQASQALNTQYGGDYVFSGGQTSTQPFTATSLTDLNPPATVASFFKDGSLAPTSQIDDNVTIQSGFTATTLGSDLMTQFQNIQAFASGTNGPFSGTLTDAQQTFLTNAINSLAATVTSTTANTAQGGDMQAQVTAAVTTQTDRQATLTTSLGDMTNINEATAAANLTQAQTAVQAAAQVFTTLKSMSLLNYLSSTTTTG
jgi:flagellar hook-associated protein 3 FlgL